MMHGAPPGPAAGPPGLLPRRVAFTVADLARVRQVTAGWAARAALSAGRAADLVLAVNEAATNAVTHGSPRAQLLLHWDGAAVTAEVHDEGHWRPAPAPPADGDRAGRQQLGLLLARRACDQVEIRPGPAGTAVVLRMTL